MDDADQTTAIERTYKWFDSVFTEFQSLGNVQNSVDRQFYYTYAADYMQSDDENLGKLRKMYYPYSSLPGATLTVSDDTYDLDPLGRPTRLSRTPSGGSAAALADYTYAGGRMGTRTLNPAGGTAALVAERTGVARDPHGLLPQRDVEPEQALELVVHQGVDRIEIERPRLAIRQDALQHGQVIAQRLATRRRRDDDHVATGANVLQCLDLMGVQRIDPHPREGALEERGRVAGQRIGGRDHGPADGSGAAHHTRRRSHRVRAAVTATTSGWRK